MAHRGWSELDVLLISGDAYIDHPAFGTALLGRLLEAEGLRVGILAQPDWRDRETLQTMGRPRLFAAVTAGAMDSMVNHYTAAKKVRNDDAYSPGGRSGLRPNRATIAYTAAIKGAFKGLPVVIGGIEASLRRLAHYDYWDDRLRRSILIDSKAELLLYGMAETAILSLCERLLNGESMSEIVELRGSALLVKQPPAETVLLPGYADLESDRQAFGVAYRLASEQTNPFSAKPLAQRYGERWLLVNPPSLPIQTAELDRIYALPFTRRPHPDYREPIPAYEQIKLSITSHRGCFGGCAFCAITHHQGKTIQSRSPDSIRAEVASLTEHPDFRGNISDVGGPTANMYGLGCNDPSSEAVCRKPSCLFPRPCPNLRCDDRQSVQLLSDLRKLPKVKHLFVASGIRFDLLMQQPDYFDALLAHHVGGLLKVAPESTSPRVTRVMRKPGPEVFESFLNRFRHQNRQQGKRQAVIPYFISGHPGCSLDDMIDVALFLKRHGLRVEQVQEFTPTPGSLATCIYYTGTDPLSGEPVHVPRNPKERRLQKALLLWHQSTSHNDIREALRLTGRRDGAELLDPLPHHPQLKNKPPKQRRGQR
ncbi:MAG: YgiQ family radical SAM protein [Desulfuromonas sp.]|nr:MAG: YgiQ family radical SAM protein [Desulfuromonas sp.]